MHGRLATASVSEPRPRVPTPAHSGSLRRSGSLTLAVRKRQRFLEFVVWSCSRHGSPSPAHRERGLGGEGIRCLYSRLWVPVRTCPPPALRPLYTYLAGAWSLAPATPAAIMTGSARRCAARTTTSPEHVSRSTAGPGPGVPRRERGGAMVPQPVGSTERRRPHGAWWRRTFSRRCSADRARWRRFLAGGLRQRGDIASPDKRPDAGSRPRRPSPPREAGPDEARRAARCACHHRARRCQASGAGRQAGDVLLVDDRRRRGRPQGDVRDLPEEPPRASRSSTRPWPGAAGSNAKAVLEDSHAGRRSAGLVPGPHGPRADGRLRGRQSGRADRRPVQVREASRNAFPKGVLEIVSANNSYWSVPVNIHRANVLWFNKKVLADN